MSNTELSNIVANYLEAKGIHVEYDKILDYLDFSRCPEEETKDLSEEAIEGICLICSEIFEEGV